MTQEKNHALPIVSILVALYVIVLAHRHQTDQLFSAESSFSDFLCL